MPAIHDHHIDEMTRAIAAAVEARGDRPVLGVVREALEAYWTDVGADTWTTNDVLQECPALTKDQARTVLAEACTDVDATVGVSWETISGRAYRLFPDYTPEKEAETIRARVASYAEARVAAGDLDSLESAFGTRDPDFELDDYDDEELLEIYRDYVLDEDFD